MTILITGATGTVGSKVVKRLAGSSQITVRATCRSAASAEELRRLNVTPVDFDFEVARGAMLEIRMPPLLIDGVLELHALGRAGRAAVVTSAVADVTGAPARRFEAFAQAAAASWRTR
ncbi:MAG TPA: NAD(P)H-binding protein [Kofleriaceae bacterium]